MNTHQLSSRRFWLFPALLFVALWMLLPAWANAVRIKDICSIEGVRENHLIGYGLVVGLNGTGDDRKTAMSVKSLAAYLRKHNIHVDYNELDVKNVAAVMVTAELPPFARQGMRVDVTVSSLGDTDNLQGGTLLATPLRPITGNPNNAGSIYAVAQGSISTGGYAVNSNSASIVKNHPTSAMIPGGAIVEREVQTQFATKPEIQLLLRNPDFTTAVRIAGAINTALGGDLASARDATAVSVKMPSGDSEERVGFLARMESLEVSPDSPARVVYNERTGTIVMGDKVRISTTIITHGNLVFESKEETDTTVIQAMSPELQSTTVVEDTESTLEVDEEKGEFHILEEGVTIGEVARGLNALGVSSRDIIAILQALKECGALQAELTPM